MALSIKYYTVINVVQVTHLQGDVICDALGVSNAHVCLLSL